MPAASSRPSSPLKVSPAVGYGPQRPLRRVLTAARLVAAPLSCPTSPSLGGRAFESVGKGSRSRSARASLSFYIERSDQRNLPYEKARDVSQGSLTAVLFRS